jgi:hypothetical protein
MPESAKDENIDLVDESEDSSKKIKETLIETEASSEPEPVLKKSQDAYTKVDNSSTSTLFPSAYRDGGLNGSLGLSYLSNGYDSARSSTSQDKLMQEYMLGYKGNIYSPRLLDYSIMGLLRYQDIDTKINEETSKTKVESQDYKVDLNFLRDSRVPFRVYAQKSDRPTSVVYEAGLIKSLNKSESAGLSGSIDFNYFDFTYSAANSDTQYESLFNLEDRNTKSYRNSIRKKEENYNFQLDYSNIEDTIQRDYANANRITTNSVEDNINLIYRWDINDDFKFDTYSYYTEKEYAGSESYASATTSANANLRWDPKTKHSASIGIDSFKIEDTFSTTESMSVRQAYGYKITKNLNVSQQSDYTIVTSDIISTESMSVGSGLNYSENISKDTRINSSLSGNVRSYRSDNNASADGNKYTVYGRAGIGHNIDSLNSQLSVNTGYNKSNSTLGDHDERYNVGLSFTTMMFSLIRNNFNASYYKEQTTLRYLDIFIDRNINTIIVDDYISNTSQVGINGSLTTKIGASYSSIENGMTKIERLNPKGDLNFKYRFSPKLIFTSDSHIDTDVIYDILTYRSNNSLAFSSQKTKISLGYNYSRIISGENSEFINGNSYTLQARFERRF